MTSPGVTLAIDLLIAVLLAATIFFAFRLERRMSALRNDQSGLSELIKGFGDASARAEASVGALKAAGHEAETSLRAAIDKAQALRDDLVFMIERGNAVADRAEGMAAKSTVKSAAKPSAARPEQSTPEPQPQPQHAPRSEAERDILEALQAARSED